MTHALKTWPEYFSLIKDDTKTFELRKDDRPFEIGDTVILQEYSPPDTGYTGREEERVISYILRDVPHLGLKKGYCILGLKEKIYQ